MPNTTPNIQSAEVCLTSTDLAADLAFYTGTLGFRLDRIFPADDPSVAILYGYGVRLRLDRDLRIAPGVLRLLCADPSAVTNDALGLTAPNGVRVVLVPAAEPLRIPATEHAFVVRRLSDSTPWVIGRAGMRYRDLIPGRLGGSIIASHIRIPDAGPVPDMVHYHTVGFQLIFCYRGWVRLVYEDQGPPFVLEAGDCVIQPPEIRHRVLEASAGLEVIEVGVPASHLTTIDHDLELPTAVVRPDREFGGQTFVRHQVTNAVWTPWRIDGFEARDTGIGRATRGVASVQVARATGPASGRATSHTADILFRFVMGGSMILRAGSQGAHPLEAGDACVIPPDLETSLTDVSPDLEFLEVTLPADFDCRSTL
jgi:quercetin dioxygenase-like cupin family protein